MMLNYSVEALQSIHDGQCALLLSVLGMGIRGKEERRYPNADEAIAYFSKGKSFVGEVHLPSYWENFEDDEAVRPQSPSSGEIDGQMSLFELLR